MAENKNDERSDLKTLAKLMDHHRLSTGALWSLLRLCDAALDVVMELARREIEREESLLAKTETDNG